MHVGGAFGSAFATDYIFFVAMRFIIGVSCTGMYSSSFVLGMELVIPSKRVAASYMLDMAWCVGLYILCFLAFVTRSWDMILLVMASLTVLLFVCLWIIPESPRWLKSKGRFIEANAVILKWETINGKKALTDTSSKNTKDDNEPESVLKMCTIPNLLIRTLLIYLNWFVIIMVNFGISLNVGNMDGDLFVNFAIISSMEMLAYTFCFLLLNKTGRKRLLVGTLFSCGGACILSVFVMLFFDKSLYWITLVLSYIGKFGITASHSIIYVWSAELFPTKVRNSGIGTSSVVGFAGSMTSPYISDLGKYVQGSFGEVLPQVIFGACSVIAGLTSLLLPETNGKALPETVFDAVQFGKKKADDRNSRLTVFYTNDAFNKDELTGEV